MSGSLDIESGAGQIAGAVGDGAKDAAGNLAAPFGGFGIPELGDIGGGGAFPAGMGDFQQLMQFPGGLGGFNPASQGSQGAPSSLGESQPLQRSWTSPAATAVATPPMQREADAAMRRSGGTDIGSIEEESKAKETKAAPTAAESELEALKVSTMAKMVETVTYAVGDDQKTCQMLYITNKQAASMNINTMAKVRQALEIEDPKLVIRLMPSRFGKAYWRSFPFTPKTVPFKGREEADETEANRVDQQLIIFAKEVLLPIVMRTHALVIGTQSCSLSAAFAAVCKPVQQMLGDDCPFNMILFARAPNVDIASRQPGTIASQFRSSSRPWMRQDFKECLYWQYGEDPAFWPHEDILNGASQCVIFESLLDGRMSDTTSDRFQTDFVTSLSQYLPVIAMQTHGDAKMKYMTTIADHVSRGLPLMLLDGRQRTNRSAQNLDSIIHEMDALRRTMHAQGEKNEHTTSLLAFVKSMLNKKHHSNDEMGLTKDTDMWLWDAMQRRTQRIKDQKKSAKLAWARTSMCNSRGNLEAPEPEVQPGSDRRSIVDPAQKAKEEEELVEAANFVMAFAGGEEEWEGLSLQKLCGEAMDEVEASADWRDLKERWDAGWISIRRYAFVRLDTLRELEAQYPWCRVKDFGKDTPKGRYMLEIHPPGIGAEPGDHREAASVLLGVFREAFEACRQHDLKHRSLKAFMDQEDKWLAVYDILKNRNVVAGNIFDITTCKSQVDLLAQIDRLPKENLMETMVLLRCAWTLRDMFAKSANFYKEVCETSYFVFLILSSAIVITSSLSALYPDIIGPDLLEYLVLGFALCTSFIAAFTMFLDPARKWLHLRGGQLELESEIWRFRARVGEYGGSAASLSPLARDEMERQAQDKFQQSVMTMRDRVLEAASLKETSFYSVTTSTDDIYVDVDTLDRDQRPEHRHVASCLRCCCRRRQQDGGASGPGEPGGKLTDVHWRHGQYPGGSLGPAPGPGEDNFHSPVSPHAYVRWRLIREQAFYRERIPRYARRRVVLQALLMCSSIASTFLAALGLSLWTSIIAAAASGLSAWQEFSKVSKKLGRYSSTSESLGKLLIWWQSLKEVDHTNVKHIEVLVDTTENLISSEQASWRSDAQKTLKHIESLSGEGGTEQASQKKAT